VRDLTKRVPKESVTTAVPRTLILGTMGKEGIGGDLKEEKKGTGAGILSDPCQATRKCEGDWRKKGIKNIKGLNIWGEGGLTWWALKNNLTTCRREYEGISPARKELCTPGEKGWGEKKAWEGGDWTRYSSCRNDLPYQRKELAGYRNGKGKKKIIKYLCLFGVNKERGSVDGGFHSERLQERSYCGEKRWDKYFKNTKDVAVTNLHKRKELRRPYPEVCLGSTNKKPGKK